MKRLILFSLFIFSCPTFVHSLNLGQIRTELRRNLRDNSSYRYTNATLLDFINEAQKEVVNQTGLSQKTSIYILTPLTTYYNLPNDLTAIESIEFLQTNNNSVLVLEQATLKSLHENMPNWVNQTGTPVQYWVDQSSSSNNLQITYIPIPTSQSTGTVTIRYYSQIDDLSSDSDVPFNGKRNLYTYHMAIVYHATMRLKAIEGKYSEVSFYLGLYNNYLKTIDSEANALPDYRPSLGVAGGR